MATRRPIKPINEQGRSLTPEEKIAHNESRMEQTYVVYVMGAVAIMIYPFVMIGRGLKKVWSLL